MKAQSIIGIVLATILTAGLAQAAPSKDAKAKTAEVTLKKVEGQIKWVGYGVGKSHAGTINVKSGEVVLDKKDVPKQISFVLDMKALDTKDSDKLKGHLKSPDFFDVEKYPEATFKSTSVTVENSSKDGVSPYIVKGDLTIKDKTAPIEFAVQVVKKDGKFTATASTEIKDRTQFGIVYHSKQFETASKLGDKLIEDNIKIDIEVSAQK
jgi:polyisoprenoid-binding protein YceI